MHGFLGSARNVATLARGLAEHDPSLGVVALDLGGHGAAPPLPAGADSSVLAHDVLAAARALDLSTPLALVGHSLGGRVALRVAQQAPDAVRSVTLLDVAPGPLTAGGEVARVLDVVLGAPEAFASRAQARATLRAAGLAPALADWLLLNLEPAGERLRWRVDRHALARLHARITAEDLWPVVEAARGWSLACVRGGASRYVGDADARRMEAAGGAVMTIEGAGHFLHVQQPQAVLAAVLGSLG